MITGRKREQKELKGLLKSGQSEFVAVYGRRRIGKTFLIRETFNYKFTFQHIGILDASLPEQLKEFRQSLKNYGLEKCPIPRTWNDAFHLLEKLLSASTDKVKLVFIDEMPWLDTPKSNFVRALDHFWNGWASARRDIVLIVCGSSTSWIVSKIINNYGGLHNRLTKQIYLSPFSLKECEEYSKSRKLAFTHSQILEAYMVMGGVPYYWSLIEKGMSLAENIDNLFFAPKGELSNEFNALYRSLFRNPEPHLSIIKALSNNKSGLSRDLILAQTGLDDNATFSKALSELEQSDFIRKFNYIGNKVKKATYQLIDNFTLFYYDFMEENGTSNPHFWSANINKSAYTAWTGFAFEKVCLLHLEQIKKALGFNAVISSAHSWFYRPRNGEKGVQIDLLIDRNDDVINLCEIKFCKTKYKLTEDEFYRLENRRLTFIEQTKTQKTVVLTMITTNGILQGDFANEIQYQITLNQLFE
ncbi:MAG: ATP-binding protein [Bacteroidales bacterium]|nr:ATP-binding protein [Bacteroidales bacterium]